MQSMEARKNGFFILIKALMKLNKYDELILHYILGEIAYK